MVREKADGHRGRSRRDRLAFASEDGPCSARRIAAGGRRIVLPESRQHVSETSPRQAPCATSLELPAEANTTSAVGEVNVVAEAMAGGLRRTHGLRETAGHSPRSALSVATLVGTANFCIG